MEKEHGVEAKEVRVHAGFADKMRITGYILKIKEQELKCLGDKVMKPDLHFNNAIEDAPWEIIQ